MPARGQAPSGLPQYMSFLASMSSRHRLQSSIGLLLLLFISTWGYQNAVVLHRRTHMQPRLVGRAGPISVDMSTAEPSQSGAANASEPSQGVALGEAVALNASDTLVANATIDAASNPTSATAAAALDHPEAAQGGATDVRVPVASNATAHGFKIMADGKLNLTMHWVGFLCIVVFLVAYASVIFEDRLSFPQFGVKYQKSISMTLAAGLMWILVASVYASVAPDELIRVETAFKRSLLEFGETFLFLVVAMTYVNTMEVLNVFGNVRIFLVRWGFTYRQMFWVTGLLSFVLSPIADNLTTALLMGAVVAAVGQGSDAFVTLCNVNIVVASNAGGAFSPFGDITTLMVWQKGKLGMGDFVHLVMPSLANWLVPAYLLSQQIPNGSMPPHTKQEHVNFSKSAITVIALFLCTIAIAVTGEPKQTMAFLPFPSLSPPNP